MSIDDEYVFPDESCENARDTDLCISFSHFKDIVIEDIIYIKKYDMNNRYFYLQNLSFDYLNMSMLSDREKEILQIYSNSHMYNDDLYEMLFWLNETIHEEVNSHVQKLIVSQC